MTDAARPLEKQEDRDYYENTEMDPRIFYVPGLGPRVHISRVSFTLLSTVQRKRALCLTVASSLSFLSRSLKQESLSPS